MYNERKLPVDQQFLLPCDLQEWLPENSLAYTILDIVSTMDLSVFYGKYRKDGIGGKFLDPAIKLTILYYAYCTGTFSSRKIEEKIHYDIAFRVLARNHPIDHTTIARFRQEFKKPIGEYFKHVLIILKDAGAIKVGNIAFVNVGVEFLTCVGIRFPICIGIKFPSSVPDSIWLKSNGRQRGLLHA